MSRQLIALVVVAAAGGVAHAQPGLTPPTTPGAPAPAPTYSPAPSNPAPSNPAPTYDPTPGDPSPNTPPPVASDPGQGAPSTSPSTSPPSTSPPPSMFAPIPQPEAPRGGRPAVQRDAPTPISADDTIGDQGISGQAGIATGGRVTPGGLRIAGHFLYQLSDRDWFDGAAAFTFGGGSGACFRDRSDAVICEHGATGGTAVEIIASVRRLYATQGPIRPYGKLGIGLGVARFSDDNLSGFMIPLHGGGGLRIKVAPTIAAVAEAEMMLGIGSYGRGLGAEPLFGFALTGGVEFRLR